MWRIAGIPSSVCIQSGCHEIVSSSLSNLPRVVLKPRRALPFFGRHPWVFAGAIQHVEGDPAAGDEVVLVSDRQEFIARGLFNPDSNIRVRLYGWEPEIALDREFWATRLDEATALRRLLAPSLPAAGSAQRIVYSEADELSGLIVDRYDRWLLVQFTSRALAERRELLVDLLEEKLRPAGIWLRTEKGIREAEGLEVGDGLIRGTAPPRPLFIEENGVRFGVDVSQGQKTGFFLDQRENRAAAAKYVEGHRVLDVFCYTGGFGLAAVTLGQARFVHGIDASEPAVTTAVANAELNGVGDKFQFERADGFDALEALESAGERFDTVVLDPPKLARHRAGVEKAMRGYFSLNRLAVGLLNPSGLLVTCSCSGHVDRTLFEGMLQQVSVETGRRIQILEARGAAPDHPTSVTCFETDYLKCYICRVV